MRSAHREAQDLFAAVGIRIGFDVRRNFTNATPTDGVWLLRSPLQRLNGTPIVAMEVPITESMKSLRGSISTLEAVSPSVAVLLVHDEDMRRRMIARGVAEDVADRDVASVGERIKSLISSSRQRFEIWSVGDLRRHFRKLTGKESLYRKGGRS
jgi:hypothetical protein